MGTQAMKDAFPDLKIKVQEIFGAGDKVTVLLRSEGTHQGVFQQDRRGVGRPPRSRPAPGSSTSPTRTC
ncbi:ester cyclase [Streptomyces sp. NPDC085639]|uniref:ester cyclase n=1 Tax=Streptomyces sp. NPDC085639 TaxID=3365734 RepID=UPI0037D33F4C